MLDNNVFYHGLIRKTIIAFGHLFSNVQIERRENNSVTGDVIQTLKVPISYAPKEKWLVRIEQDPNLDNNTYVSLPRMSFEITGYSYDSSRKLGKVNQIVCNSPDSATTVFSPVPYNVDISLYVLTKTQEDAMQIIEQILPTFTPDYTLSIAAVPDMSIVQDVPIALNGITLQDEYDGSFETRRFVTHTLNFTLKLNLFGPIKTGRQIYHVSTSVDTVGSGIATITYRADGDPATQTITFEGWEGF